MTTMSAIRAAPLLAVAVLASAAQARDPSDCTGLAPPRDLPPALEATLEGAGGLCRIVGSDGAGNFVFERIDSGVVDLRFFSADGRATGALSFSGTSNPATTPYEFLGQSEGYLVHFSEFDSATAQSKEFLAGLGPDGTTRGQTILHDTTARIEQHLVLADPRSGAVVVDVTNAPGSPAGPESPWSIVVRRVSASGVEIGGARVLESGARRIPTVAAQVARDGSLLLLSAGYHFPPLRNNQLAGRWFDLSGGPITPWFLALDQVLGESGAAFDGGEQGVVVSLGERRAIAPPRLARAEVSPPWLPGFLPSLVQLPDRIAVVSSTNEPCANQIEIRAPAGNVCGRIDIPAPTRNGFCQSTLSITIGRDGTALQQTSNGDVCTVRWWKRLLQ